jgi:hypothetical protein
VRTACLAPLAAFARAALLSIGLALPLTRAHAADESELKAAIVFNVLVFVEWPDELKTLDLCVGADNPLLPALKQLEGRELRNKTFRVQELKTDAVSASCRAAFVDAADRTKRAPLMKSLSDLGVFMISDDADAPPRSTAVVMQRVGARIVLDINQPAVRQARVQVSSKLLRLARTVRE